MNTERKPHLRIALTPNCNFRCTYCRPGGEGYYEDIDHILSKEEIINISSICGDIGFKDMKLTGGEPLLRQDLEQVIKGIKDLKKFDSLDMVTNGSLLLGRTKYLKEAGIEALTVSLDAAEKEKFYAITGSKNFDIVLKGIGEATSMGIKTRINTVMGNSNKDQLMGLVEIAKETGTELKIIDIMDINTEEKSWGRHSWDKEYLNLSFVIDELSSLTKEMTTSFPPGGLGSPMTTLLLKNGVRVLLRDATIGTNYDSITCGHCENYPCQDALISLRLTHNGFLKKCLIRNDNLTDVITPLRQGNLFEVKDRIKKSYDIFMRANYIANAWKK